MDTLAMTKLELGNDQGLVTIAPITLHPSIFTLPLMAFLETDTEADGGVEIARVVGEAIS